MDREGRVLVFVVVSVKAERKRASELRCRTQPKVKLETERGLKGD